jgi:hypothetical protein
MPLNYENINEAQRERVLVASTGYGNTALLSDADALSAEQQCAVLDLRRAIFEAAAADSAEPQATGFARQAEALAASCAEARAAADRINAVTNTDVSGVMADVLAKNRAVLEQQHFDATWLLANRPDLTPEEQATLQLQIARAERDAGVIDNWPPA